MQHGLGVLVAQFGQLLVLLGIGAQLGRLFGDSRVCGRNVAPQTLRLRAQLAGADACGAQARAQLLQLLLLLGVLCSQCGGLALGAGEVALHGAGGWPGLAICARQRPHLGLGLCELGGGFLQVGFEGAELAHLGLLGVQFLESIFCRFEGAGGIAAAGADALHGGQHALGQVQHHA